MIVNEVSKKVVGQEAVIKTVLAAIICEGSVLMEGAPGLGKTLLVKTLAEVLDLPFSRIQFTPDLMPVDITGTLIANRVEGRLEFTFERGPLFTSLLLADEINRATPKTQSALLEAMQEKTVTAGGKSYRLPEPFFVLATQNPLEMEGTYRLPEAQLDRFMFKLNMVLPAVEDLYKIIDLTVCGKDEPVLQVQARREELQEMKQIVRQLPVPSVVKEKAVKIMLETHPERSSFPLVKEYVKSGSSPRGLQAMLMAARVWALAEGRFHTAVADLLQVALPSLRHRIFLNFKALSDRVEADMIIEEVLRKVK